MVDATKVSLGQKLAITNRNGSVFRGSLCRIDEIGGKLVLKNVTTCGSKLFGPQHFVVSDIDHIEYENGFEGFSGESLTSPGHHKNCKHLLAKKNIPIHVRKLRKFDTDELVLSHTIFSEDGDQGIGSEEEGVADYNDFYTTDDCTLICRICDKFNEAIIYLSEQEIIGVTFEGVDIGRDGTLSLVQMATETDTIIFDVLRIGDEAFGKGLRAVLESRDILKVIHDCRWISDMLTHKYSIALNNIFDTQVASAFVFRFQNEGDWPRYVESLPGCLVTHLKLSSEQVFYMRVRERSQQKDQEVWLQRPISETLLSLACKNVRYLIRLHGVLLDKMLLAFHVGVELYLDHVKDAAPDNVEKIRANRHLLPWSFVDIQKYVDYSSKKSDGWRKARYGVNSNHQEFRYNCLKIHDPQIVSSHNSIWHRAEDYYDAFRKRETNNQTTYKSSDGIPAEERNSDKNWARNGSLRRGHNKRQGTCGDGRASSHSGRQEDYADHRHRARCYSDGQKDCCDDGAGSDDDVAGCGDDGAGCHSIGLEVSVGISSNKAGNMSPNTSGSSSIPILSHGITACTVNKSNRHPVSGCLEGECSYPDSVSGGADDEVVSPDARSVDTSVPSTHTPVNPPVLLKDSDSPGDSKVKSSLLYKILQKNGPQNPPSDSDILPYEPSESRSHESLTQKNTKAPSVCLPYIESENERAEKVLSKLENLKFASSLKYCGGLSPARRLDFQNVQTSFSDNQDRPIGSSNYKEQCVASSSSSSESELSSHSPRGTNVRMARVVGKKSGSLFSDVLGSKKTLEEPSQTEILRLRLGVSSESDSEGRVPRPPRVTNDCEAIPMQESLKQQKFTRLGSSAIGFGDLFTEDKPHPPQIRGLANNISLMLADNDETIPDQVISNLEKTETFKKVIKLASSASSSAGDIKSRLLPPKYKLSPSPGT